MFQRIFILIFICSARIQCDLTNLADIFSLLKQNQSINYPMGFMTKANVDVVKRYLRGNINVTMFKEKSTLLKAIDNEEIIAGITTGHLAEDLEPNYHVFSSSIISPQAMLVAPDYNEFSTPYGLKNQSSTHLFDALSAAIADVQRDDIDETLLSRNNLTDVIRVFTCHQDSQLPVPNRNEITGFLRDILFDNGTLLIGALKDVDWGTHDGNYKLEVPIGFYPELLTAVMDQLPRLKGPDGIVYGEKISWKRVYRPTMELIFQDLLNGDIHATDVYALIDAPYIGTNESCLNNTSCRAEESCTNGFCTHPERPRSLHFRTTCTTASRDTKFITKKGSKKYNTNTNNSTTKQTPKTRWIAFLLLFTALFGTIFLTLLILIRRKKHYRVEHTLQGGFGKFVRLQEESEPPMEGMDAFDDHIVQSPRDNTNSTS